MNTNLIAILPCRIQLCRHFTLTCKRLNNLTFAVGFSLGCIHAQSNTTQSKQADRAVIEAGIRSIPRNPVITSRDRTSPPSAAHDRGAVDFRSNNVSPTTRHSEARELSNSLGRKNTVVVEEVHRPNRGAEGPSVQVNTAYRDGTQGNTRVGPVRATQTHTHVQPERRGVR